MSKKILLHVCCAPCAGGVVQRLREEGYSPTLFWCNPNIFPEMEAELRRKEVLLWAEREGLEVVEDKMTHADWLQEVKGLEKEPERGARCTVCFIVRLKRTAEAAKRLGFEEMGTTLTVSRHKNSSLINELGTEIASGEGVRFLARDWKQDGGEILGAEIARREGFYRQSYCGCEFGRKK